MDRENVYEKWMAQKMSNGEAFAGKKTIDGCRKLSDENFDVFYNYVESIIEDSAFKNRRSTILHFMVFINNEGIDLKSVSQECLDKYFAYCRDEKSESDNNIIKRVNFLKSFFSKYKNTMENEVDLDKYRISKAEKKVRNPMKALTIKQL
ncbi:MAG: phage integrase SAM-like domain-containing protein, partial [Eubacterium sp.]|nr:phage integrase SAM-like domain-containing protein [Eubacterium sp.]